MSVDINYLKILICILHRERASNGSATTHSEKQKRIRTQFTTAKKREKGKSEEKKTVEPPKSRKTISGAEGVFGPKSGDKM